MRLQSPNPASRKLEVKWMSSSTDIPYGKERAAGEPEVEET